MTVFVHSRVDLVQGAVIGALQAVVPTCRMEELLLADRGTQAIAWLRQLGMYVMVARFDVSQGATARCFGRDRTTVRHAIRLVDNHIAENHITGLLAELVEKSARQQLEQIENEEAATGYLPPVRTREVYLHG